MKQEQLLVARIDQLRERIGPGCTELDLLDASATLRILLIDRLLKNLAEEHEVPVVFNVHRLGVGQTGAPKKGVLLDIFFEGMTASLPTENDLKFSPDEFLKHPMLVAFDTTYTVDDCIRVAANSYGGIHHGDNRRPRPEKLRKFDEGTGRGDDSDIGDLSYVLSLIRDIARCTIAATAPLYEKLASASGASSSA